MDLELEAGTYAICRLPPDAPVPTWATDVRGLVSVTRTRDELSLVVPERVVPATVPAEGTRRSLAVVGPLAFTLTGVLAALAVPLAEAAVPVFVLSTFDTDRVLVADDDLERAIAALEGAGHVVTRAADPAAEPS